MPSPHSATAYLTSGPLIRLSPRPACCPTPSHNIPIYFSSFKVSSGLTTTAITPGEVPKLWQTLGYLVPTVTGSCPHTQLYPLVKPSEVPRAAARPQHLALPWSSLRPTCRPQAGAGWFWAERQMCSRVISLCFTLYVSWKGMVGVELKVFYFYFCVLL